MGYKIRETTKKNCQKVLSGSSVYIINHFEITALFENLFYPPLILAAQLLSSTPLTLLNS